MLHRGLSFAVQYVQLDADDLQASYVQENEPGPLPNPHSHMQGKDGAAISIRRLLLLPDRAGGNFCSIPHKGGVMNEI